MADAIELDFVDRVLSHVAWVPRKRSYHMEKQPRVPRLRQSDVAIRAYLCTSDANGYTVRDEASSIFRVKD